ncbi:glutathione S-transferase family protein [Acidimangrovimonas pyrenivorans]|uniref:Glutathione S-transferase family protein n=1 Tax=Acidimangrovimonas pyrenivorans TaxID=2030798 RepID=A0ABV7AEF2_9RHOB
MTDLSAFPITRRWPPRDAYAIQLYSFPTPNGIKIAVMLEECGLAYDAHTVSFKRQDQMTPEFLSLNPNNKIPAIIDPDGPEGTPFPLFESGAILIYLAEKTGKFLPQAPAQRYQVLQWLMFQMGGIGPMFGQLGYFYHTEAGLAIEDKRPLQRYADETARILKVLEGQLQGRDWIAGDYSIADMAIGPWLRVLRDIYHGEGLVGWRDLKNVPAYLDRFLARPAVARSLNVPRRDG